MSTILRTLYSFLATVALLMTFGYAMSESSLPRFHPPASRSPPSALLPTRMHFEVNRGQVNSQVQFFSRSNGYHLFLTSYEAVLTFPTIITPTSTQPGSLYEATQETPAVLRMRVVGGNSTTQPVGEKALQGKAHYFLGNDPAKWHSQVPIYGQVRYSNIYSGIDLVYYGHQQQLEYDFIIAPGEDPSVITMEFEGMDTLELDPNGDVLLHISGGMFRQRQPLIYQEVDGKRLGIPGRYRLISPNQVGFEVAAYDIEKPLIIDPVLVYSSYLGGSNSDAIHDMAVDNEGNVYVMGLTLSTDFPVMDPLQPSNAIAQAADFFVTKFSPDGSALLYATYLGGSAGESGRPQFTPPMEGGGIAVDALGQAYVTGTTASSDFPVRDAWQPAKAGRLDAFITKLAADGSDLMYSTYLGGPTHLEFGVTPRAADNRGNDIAIDAAGNAYVTGVTDARDFPTLNAFQSSYAGGILVPALEGDAFITKMNSDGSALVYSSYLGGKGAEPHPFLGYDEGVAIAVDQSGSAYVTGVTAAADFPTHQPFQAIKAGVTDIFLTKLTPDGSAPAYSTFLGGSKNIVPEEFFMEHATGITVNTTGHAFLTGWTYSDDFPLVQAFQPAADLSGEHRTCFISKMTTDGTGLEYSTYLSGTHGPEPALPLLDRCKDIMVDTTGNVYVTGETASEDFPVTADALQSSNAGNLDAFVATLTPDGSALAYSSYLGGINGDRGTRISMDPDGNIFVSGQTVSTDFPILDAFQESHNGNEDGFLVKFAPAPLNEIVDAGPSLTVIFPNQAALTGTVIEDKISPTPGPVTILWDQVNGPGLVTFDQPAAVNTTAQFSEAGTYVLRLAATKEGITASDHTTITVKAPYSVNQAPVVTAGPDQTITLSGEAFLDGIVTDDGLPGDTLTTNWAQVSGPGITTFIDPNTVDTTASFNQEGMYVLRLTASDGTLEGFDEVTVNVNSPGAKNPLYDLNGDGTADLIWRNKISGEVAIWLMNGPILHSSGFLGSPPAQWKIVGLGDVNGDGKADVIWKSTSSNIVAVWLMNGLSIYSTAFLGGVSPAWKVQGIGDINGDGTADIIWRNEHSGQVTVWVMDGGAIASSTFLAGVPLSWELAGVGDFFRDGKADLIWRNSITGTMALWHMNGPAIHSTTFIGAPSSGWKVQGIDDVNGDGNADLIWQNTTTHIIAVWLMNGSTILSSGFLGGALPPWTIEQVADCNGDGKADVIWQNMNSGAVAVWLLDGTAIESAGFPGGVSPSWQIQP